MRVYFDNAATTPLTPSVKLAMSDCMDTIYGNPSSIHQEGRNARTLVEQARKSVAKYLNASIGEIFFTSGGTESNNTAIKCAVRDLGVRRLISSSIEHHCVLNTIKNTSAKENIDRQYVALDSMGRIDLDHLEKLLQSSTEKTLVSLMHVNNELGNILAIDQVSLLCRKYGAFLHTDTVQSIGHDSFNLAALDIDFISGSAHKFHGPKGVGFLYINSNISILPYIDGGSQERNMRGGTENIIGIAGLKQAIDDAFLYLEERKNHINLLKNTMIEGLNAIDGNNIGYNGDFLNGSPKILSVNFPGTAKNDLIVFNLEIHAVNASGGSACSSGVESASHVMNAIDPTDIRKTVRFSFSHLNTLDEVQYTVDILSKLLVR